MSNVSNTVLSWIKTEVDHALKVVRDNIAKFSAVPEDVAVLRVCPDRLHQVSGALRIVGLAGATRFCEAIEGAFSKVSTDRPSKAAIGVLDRAVLALKEFIDDLAQGQANVPLRLFSVYRELTTLEGKSEISEKDLFFPDLSPQAPSHPGLKVPAKDRLAPYLQTQRARFQRGLVAWLRNQPSGLQEMRQALDALHQIAPLLPEPRALWWASAGLIDGLLDAPNPDWVRNANMICNKLDFQMRDLLSGSQKGGEALLREVLYAIAKCKPATPLIREIRQIYQLDSLFPEPDLMGLMEFDMDWLQPALNDARSRLEALKGVWLQYISGEPDSVARFRELIASFKDKAVELGNHHLVRLLEVIVLVSTRLPDPYPKRNQFMVIELASAFLLVESIIESFTNPPPDLEQQIKIMGGWLLDAVQGKSTGEPPPGLRADLSRQIGVLQLRAQVAKEILINLQHVEQVLDAFARDPSRRATLPGLKPYLRQIHGALFVLRFERAAKVVSSICDPMIEACARADHAGTVEDMEWIAEGLSALGFYLDPCIHGREPAEQPITLFLSRLEKRGAPVTPAGETAQMAPVPEAPAVAPKQAQSATQPAPEARPTSTAAEAPPVTAAKPVPAEVTALPPLPVDKELLSIFLVEAGEVLATIDAGVPVCRKQPQDREALTAIRRGFHTLKGSGRMVGLTDLGEIAWEVEQVMNRWLEQQHPATPELLEMITLASTSFAGWVDKLKAGETIVVEARRIVDLARRLKSEKSPAVPAPADAAPVPAAVPPEPVVDIAAASASEPEVAIGNRRLSRGFFDIYRKEAAQHVASLETEFAAWRVNPGSEASHGFLRSAHTLASSSRTAGFTEIAELAGAVEQWLPFARQTTGRDDTHAVQSAIQKLRKMVDAVAQVQQPWPAERDVSALNSVVERLQAAPPPPVPAAPLAPTPPAAVELPPADAAPPPPAARPKEQRALRDDIDPQLLPIFVEEAQQLLPQIGSDLREWKTKPRDPNVAQSLQRALHTLKGSARMAGAIRLGELTHTMESRIEAALEADDFPPALFEALESGMDRLSLDVERMQHGGMAATPAAATPAAVAAPAAAPGTAAAEHAPRVEPPLPSPVAMLRINADTLDHLINESGEVSIARSRAEGELRVIKQALSDLSDSIARMRNQLREVEIQADSQMQSREAVLEEQSRKFDPLEFDRYTRLQELTRMMAETLHDVTSIHQGMLKNLGDTDAALQQQARTSRGLQQALMRMRTVPFSNLNERLYRIVRQTARELDKEAELEIQGSEVELDRSVLERISAPLEHLLRNALAHGVEPSATRTAAGKPEAGRIVLDLRQESNEIALVLSDDGAGIDLEKLHRTALDKNLLQAGQPVTDSDLMQLIFVSGISTADEVTALSGRGVGMDVVRSEIAATGGRVEVASVAGKGTTFTIYLPLTLAVTQAVVVRAGGNVLAISSAMVEQVMRLKSDALSAHYAAKTIDSQGTSFPLHCLQHLLGATGAAEIRDYNSVLLLRSGIQRIALHVDELIGNQEIVIKNIGPQLARVPGIAGATVLGDGSIALIINPVVLAQRSRAAQTRPAVSEPVVSKAAAPVVLVVDDSLTVRKITGKLLEREGYQVLTAKDGVDALEQMKNSLPDILLVDIEMPRMDGYDLTRAVRGDPRTRGIPIIIITSRTAEKHRNQAAQLGVNAFLGKPYEEAELLEHLIRHLAPRRA